MPLTIQKITKTITKTQIWNTIFSSSIVQDQRIPLWLAAMVANSGNRQIQIQHSLVTQKLSTTGSLKEKHNKAVFSTSTQTQQCSSNTPMKNNKHKLKSVVLFSISMIKVFHSVLCHWLSTTGSSKHKHNEAVFSTSTQTQQSSSNTSMRTKPYIAFKSKLLAKRVG